MRRIASATLSQQTSRSWQRSIEIVELDLPPAAGDARFIVSLRQGSLSPAGLMLAPQESALTAAPCSQAEARRRAIDFIRRRLSAGDVLLQSQGLELPAQATSGSGPISTGTGGSAAHRPAPAAGTAAAAPSPAVAALVSRFSLAQWPLQSSDRRARSAWRVAERSDPLSNSADQQALRALVPRLVDLLETGGDLLDYCLAVAIARLGDRGAGEAMFHLRERGRSPATKRAAHQAWLVLQTPQAQRAHADALLPQWQALLKSAVPRAGEPDWPTTLAALLEGHFTHWLPLLGDGYDIALANAEIRSHLLQLLRKLPLEPGPFQALRYLYKAAEIRRDVEVIGLLHARMENTRAHQQSPEGRGFGRPYGQPPARTVGTGRGRVSGPEAFANIAYSSRTRDYLRLRAWRQLRRLAEIHHSQAAPLATALLLGLDDRALPPASQERHTAYIDRQYVSLTRYYHGSARWLLVPKLLLPRHPDMQITARATRWWTTRPLDDAAPPQQRIEGLPAMWDAHPEALLALALNSQAALVHAMAARALQDHAGFVAQQPAELLQALLRSAYAPTAHVGFQAVKLRVQQTSALAEQVPWLRLLADSSDAEAREFAFVHIAADSAGFAQHAGLAVQLLLSAHQRNRRQGQGLALMAPAATLMDELQAALLAIDAQADGLADAVALVESLLQSQLAEAAAQASVEPLLCLLDHGSPAVLNLAASWLLLHRHGSALVPPETLLRLLNETDSNRRAAGVRLLAALPDEVLLTQQALLCSLAVNPHAGIRAAVGPALLRLSAKDSGFASTLAQALHNSLFSAEAAEGLHDDALAWLRGGLQACAPARDASGTWRALQAQSRGAQRYGAWALAALQPGDFSLKQLATLARHADVSVRQWAMQAITQTLPPQPSPEQSAQLLPLADALFDDARAFAQSLFGETLPDESLAIELLIAWIDHPQPWMQALGRSRLVRRMTADEASLCLISLSQHPSTQVQLFVTQWLLELPRDKPAELVERLRALQPYFVTVLSQVHRGRAAKTRITEFLRSLTDVPETAVVVAEVFARQVVTSNLSDKPQYIAGLRDIAARHPQIELPFIAWQAPVRRAAGNAEVLAANAPHNHTSANASSNASTAPSKHASNNPGAAR